MILAVLLTTNLPGVNRIPVQVLGHDSKGSLRAHYLLFVLFEGQFGCFGQTVDDVHPEALMLECVATSTSVLLQVWG